MRRDLMFRVLSIITCVTLMVALMPETAFAHPGGFLIFALYAIFFHPILFWGVILAAFFGYLYHRDNTKGHRFVDKLGGADALWRLTYLRSSICNLFSGVVKARINEDYALMEASISDGFLQRVSREDGPSYKLTIADNVERVVLRGIEFQEVKDYKDDANSYFWAILKGYVQTRKPGRFLVKKHRIKEPWKFVRKNGNWLVDEIDVNNKILYTGDNILFSERVRT